MKQPIIILLIVLLFCACSDTVKNEQQVITVSIEPLRFMTEQIAGKDYTVETMVPQGMSPETYEPTVRQMAHLADSKAFVKVGAIGFERTWLPRLQANVPTMKVVDASHGIKPIKTAGGNDDPHTWMSTTNARLMARNICKGLKEVYPDDSLLFNRNTERLIAKIDSVDQRVRTLLRKSTLRAFLIYHPILTYYAHDYGLRQIPVEEEGREPSASQIEATIQTARNQGVKVLFVQQQFSENSVRAVGKAVGATTIAINPLGYDWCEQMISIAQNLQ